jgi:hypothetical protein
MALKPYNARGLSNYGQATAIVPADGADQGVFQGLYIGATGDVTVTLAGMTAGTSVLFKAVPIGILPVQFTRVWATGTTATLMLGLG